MSCRTDISKVRNDVHDLRSDLLGLQMRVASPVAALAIGRAWDLLLQVHDELGDALKMPVDTPDDERAWMRMDYMPIGDQRNKVVQVRGECGSAALAYWTGQMWAHAPVSPRPSPIGFKPLEWRFPVAETALAS